MIKKIAYGILFLIFLGCVGFAALVARPCGTNTMQFMNATNADIRITVGPDRYPNVYMLDFILSDNKPATFRFELIVEDGSYLVTAENLETGEVFSDIFGYASSNDAWIHFFLIDGNGIHFNYWNMFSNDLRGFILYGFYYLANEASCLDNRFF